LKYKQIKSTIYAIVKIGDDIGLFFVTAQHPIAGFQALFGNQHPKAPASEILEARGFPGGIPSWSFTAPLSEKIRL
jgi:hypothetical protein